MPKSLGGVAKNSYSKKVTESAAIKGTWIDYIISPFTFLTGSKFNIEIHSDVVDLGTFTANELGGSNLRLQVPRELPAGYHTIFINGINPMGEAVEVTQTILIKGGDPNDIDEDGRFDSTENCPLFIDNSICTIDEGEAGSEIAPEIKDNTKMQPGIEKTYYIKMTI